MKDPIATKKKSRGFSIKSKLLIFGLCISLIPIAIITTIYYLSARSVLEQQTLDEMTAIAESKRLHVMSFFETKKTRAAGCNGYIEKPIDPEKVISQIRHILGENS